MKKQNKILTIILLISIITIIAILITTTNIFKLNKDEIEKNDETIEETTFNYNGNIINVKFLGEIQNNQLFGNQKITDIAHPIDNQGKKQGQIYNDEPNWLKFEYKVNNVKKTVLIAKEPIMNFVSFDDIARIGAARGDNTQIFVKTDNSYYYQNKTITDLNQNEYKIRLIDCGDSTTNPTSEWNFLIGGIHEGDVDFKNTNTNTTNIISSQKIYSFIDKPYKDEDLKVGQNGSLTWCKNEYYKIDNHIVNRGYFFASRFHASNTHLRTNRLYWRPILELIEEKNETIQFFNELNEAEVEIMPIIQITPTRYIETITNQELFEDKLSNLIKLKKGTEIDNGTPEWLKFEKDNKTILIAKKPIKHTISYKDLLDEKLVLGERTIQDKKGNNYILRLIKCGENTMDHNSEWNSLIGMVSAGDNDFKNKIYSTIKKPITDEELHIGAIDGAATWCQETKKINNETYAVNRGYLTVSRYHLTDISFLGTGFSYRPVLEQIN